MATGRRRMRNKHDRNRMDYDRQDDPRGRDRTVWAARSCPNHTRGGTGHLQASLRPYRPPTDTGTDPPTSPGGQIHYTDANGHPRAGGPAARLRNRCAPSKGAEHPVRPFRSRAGYHSITLSTESCGRAHDTMRIARADFACSLARPCTLAPSSVYKSLSRTSHRTVEGEPVIVKILLADDPGKDESDVVPANKLTHN